MKNDQETKVIVEYDGLEKSIIEKRKDIREFTYALDDFSQEADSKNSKKHRSYVYALCEKVGNSLIPFYIGEGKGPRVWAHDLEASKQMKLLEEDLKKGEISEEEYEGKKKELSKKIQKIDEIKDRKGEVVKYIIKWGMTSNEAFMAESALINLLQIGGLKFECKEKKNKLTNIVKGHQSEGEKQTGSTKARTIEDFCNEFAKEPLYFEDLQKNKVKALLININKGYKECVKFEDEEERNKAIKDTTCGNWKISKTRVEKLGIEYVFATVQARVVGIYKIKEVWGKKFHYSYEAAYENSEYPHGAGTVPFRENDYQFAKLIKERAEKKGKAAFDIKLDDMPKEYRNKLEPEVEKENKKRKANKKGIKKEITADDLFDNKLKRIFMILEDIPKDDPHYDEYKEYMHRRIIHFPSGENIYGKGNPIRFIEN